MICAVIWDMSKRRDFLSFLRMKHSGIILPVFLLFFCACMGYGQEAGLSLREKLPETAGEKKDRPESAAASRRGHFGHGAPCPYGCAAILGHSGSPPKKRLRATPRIPLRQQSSLRFS